MYICSMISAPKFLWLPIETLGLVWPCHIVSRPKSQGPPTAMSLISANSSLP